MTREELIKILKKKHYTYKIDGDKLVVTGGTEFGGVDLRELTTLPSDVVFKNGGVVYLSSLTSLPPDVMFKNGGTVYLKALIGDTFFEWKGNIEGIDHKRLLNYMTSKGLFEK